MVKRKYSRRRQKKTNKRRKPASSNKKRGKRRTRNHSLSKKRYISHNGRKVFINKGGSIENNLPISFGYKLGGVDLSPNELNLANPPPHLAYKKCL